MRELIKIKKRTKQIALFDASKISSAIAKTGKETKEFDEKIAKRLSIKVIQYI